MSVTQLDVMTATVCIAGLYVFFQSVRIFLRWPLICPLCASIFSTEIVAFTTDFIPLELAFFFMGMTVVGISDAVRGFLKERKMRGADYARTISVYALTLAGMLLINKLI